VQIVCHEVKGYEAAKSANAVDGDAVPVPHFGLVLSVPQVGFGEFRALTLPKQCASLEDQLLAIQRKPKKPKQFGTT